MGITLAQKPGWSDFPNAQLAAEDFARGSAFVAALDNTKFGAVRLEFFYGNYVDGDMVPLPVSTADGYKYKASELIYLWTPRLTANPKDGKTGGPGTILWMDFRVEQSDDADPGLVHSKVVYHVEGSETTETEDGKLGVTTIAIRGRDELTAAAAPTWTDQADSEYNLDSVLKTERATRMNDNAKLSVLQTEIFDMGEFGDLETVPLKTSPLDGYVYAYVEMTFLYSWRITAKKADGITSGAAGETITRMRASVGAADGVVGTQVDYRFPTDSSGGTNTTDGIIQVVAICVRSGLAVSGTVAFDDLDDKAFFSGVILGDDDVIKINQNSKFSVLRPEIFVTAETDGDTVPLPVSAIDGYVYVRAECFYIWVRDDTGAPVVGGSFLALHGFIRQDTGVVKNKLLFHQQKGSGSTQSHGGFRCITIAMRTKDVEVDADGGAAGGGGEGFDGSLDNDLISGGGILLMRNPDFESGDRDWTKQTGFTIEKDPANAYDGDWVAKFVGTAPAALLNAIIFPCLPGTVVLGHCFGKRTAGDGGVRFRFNWLKADRTNNGTINGNAVNASDYAISRIVGTAPANTAFVRAEALLEGLTVETTAFWDQFYVAFFPLNLKDVPDGGGFGKTTPNQVTGAGNAFEGLLSDGRLKAGKFVDSLPGLVSGAQQIATGNSSSTAGWIQVSTVDFDVPANTNSIAFNLSWSGNGFPAGSVKVFVGDNLGISIHTGGAPATPDFARTGNGVLTVNNPVGDKLTLYLRLSTQANFNTDIDAFAKQDLITAFRTGFVT